MAAVFMEACLRLACHCGLLSGTAQILMKAELQEAPLFVPGVAPRGLLGSQSL